ncbi:S41 family peptidase [Luminiphilus sp. nBUS_07]|uniref:S41 family peptidase n=1 Tax=Luminiphilus sp. nBUS_07 TaxID=3395314 RepID=UPI003EC12EF8
MTVRILSFFAAFCASLQGVQASPSEILNGLVGPIEAARRASPVVDQACGEEGKKEFVSLVAQSWYLWYEELAPVSPDDYPTAQAYLNAITAPLAPDGRDPGFSYITTQAADNAQGSTGAYVGYGFSYAFDSLDRFMFSDVLQGGPAGDAEFRRGDEVLAIDVGNGFETIAQLSQRQATTAEVFGASEAGVERSFRVRQEQSVIEVTLTKRELVTPPLATEPLLLERAGNSPVGYLNLRSFISTANDALADATQVFRDAGVTDLVIDLRYNGGGLVSVADTMLDLLGGLAATGQDSWRITHNDMHSEEDFGAVFAALETSMQPMRIAFITTGGTASASELVINSLAPHIEVVIVGEDTLGKAVGQYAFDQSQVPEWASCDTRLRLIAFQIVNGEGDGGYYNGLVSSGGFTFCPAKDDLTRNFGDPEESSLNAALGWLNNGFCSANTATINKVPRLRRLDDNFENTPRWHLAELPDAPFGLSPWVQ